MKKVITILGITYTVMCIGVGIYMFVMPESYGKWIGKMTTGLFSTMSVKEGEI